MTVVGNASTKMVVQKLLLFAGKIANLGTESRWSKRGSEGEPPAADTFNVDLHNPLTYGGVAPAYAPLHDGTYVVLHLALHVTRAGFHYG